MKCGKVVPDCKNGTSRGVCIRSIGHGGPHSSGMCRVCGLPSHHKGWCLKCQRDYSKNRKKQIKIEVFSWYGSVCRCCKESFLDFLTIDHMKDDGLREIAHLSEQEKMRNGRVCGGGHIFYRKLYDVGFESRPLDLQLLCWNCQWGKRLNNGFCPHHPEIDLREHSV